MSASVARRQRPRIFYGWWLLGAATLTNVLQGGFMAYGFGAFLLPLVSALGASRGALSAAFSFTRLESSLLGPVEGVLIDRFGPRGMMYIGFAVFGLSFVLFSRVDSLLGFYLVFPLIALGASMSGFLPSVTAVNNWFARRRGLATGIASSGVQIGGVLVALVALGIGSYGWRTTALVMGLIVWIVGFPIAAMMRHRPQPYGYLPDGDEPGKANVPPVDEGSPHGAAGQTPARSHATSEPDFTAMQAMRTPAFWVIAGTHGLSLLIIGAVTLHEIPLLVDAGLSFEAAASVLAFMTAVAMVGRIAGGYLGDRVGAKLILIICFFLMSAGVVVLAFSHTVAQAMVFAVVYGLGYGARAPILIALRGEYFGPRSFATIMGFSQPIQVLGSFFGPVIAGVAYDIQGSYLAVFLSIALVNLLGALMVLFIKKPSVSQGREAATVTEG